MIANVQRGLELLYRIDTQVNAQDFVIGRVARDVLVQTRAAREQLLIVEQNGDVELALFVDERVLNNLMQHNPRQVLDRHNLQDFLLLVEGVSHLLYVVWCARCARSVSALEMEIQGEVDKYVTCLLVLGTHGSPQLLPADLKHLLFERFSWADGLDDEEQDRYRYANVLGKTYATSLESRFVRTQRITDMLHELRYFYRLSACGKMEHISQVAS